jgi:hypothetical protein
MLRMAADVGDPVLSGRLEERALKVLDAVPAPERARVRLTHAVVRAAPFLVGGLAEALQGLVRDPLSLTERALEPRLHVAGPLAESHFEDSANGLVASLAHEVLDEARMTGDPNAREAGRRLLERLERDRGTVPRGAQTWEVPLHTPDILASARAVSAFVSAFEVESKVLDLEAARYWAWTGVPFVYLWSRKDLACMRYATIPVLGATHYKGPDWIGLPVQWCGLCYAEALYRLWRYDRSGPWKAIADGIVIAGLQMQLVDGPAAGCLPDSFVLETQAPQGPMINPGSLYALLPSLDGRPPLLDSAVFRDSGVILHAPGRITISVDRPLQIGFSIDAPDSGPFELALVRAGEPASVSVDGLTVQAKDSKSEAPGYRYLRDSRLLILSLPRSSGVVVDLRP